VIENLNTSAVHITANIMPADPVFWCSAGNVNTE
jgi:hypothetical protein